MFYQLLQPSIMLIVVSSGIQGSAHGAPGSWCRAALETGLAQKRKPAGAAQERSSKKQSGMMSAVLGDLSGESSDEDS